MVNKIDGLKIRILNYLKKGSIINQFPIDVLSIGIGANPKATRQALYQLVQDEKVIVKPSFRIPTEISLATRNYKEFNPVDYSAKKYGVDQIGNPYPTIAPILDNLTVIKKASSPEEYRQLFSKEPPPGLFPEENQSPIVVKRKTGSKTVTTKNTNNVNPKRMAYDINKHLKSKYSFSLQPLGSNVIVKALQTSYKELASKYQAIESFYKSVPITPYGIYDKVETSLLSNAVGLIRRESNYLRLLCHFGWPVEQSDTHHYFGFHRDEYQGQLFYASFNPRGFNDYDYAWINVLKKNWNSDQRTHEYLENLSFVLARGYSWYAMQNAQDTFSIIHKNVSPTNYFLRALNIDTKNPHHLSNFMNAISFFETHLFEVTQNKIGNFVVTPKEEFFDSFWNTPYRSLSGIPTFMLSASLETNKSKEKSPIVTTPVIVDTATKKTPANSSPAISAEKSYQVNNAATSPKPVSTTTDIETVVLTKAVYDQLVALAKEAKVARTQPTVISNIEDIL